MDERDLLSRLDVAEARLVRAAELGPLPGLTEPDPGATERWDAGQVWAHVAEFVGYWLVQLEKVRAAPPSEPATFGRVKTDEGRLAAIEAGRHRDPAALLEETRRRLIEARRFVADLEPEELERIGLHPTLGAMSLDTALDRFIVGHLEEHAAQLEALATT